MKPHHRERSDTYLAPKGLNAPLRDSENHSSSTLFNFRSLPYNTIGNPIETLFGREIAGLRERKKEELIENAFKYWRDRGFPFPTADEQLACREIRSLMNICASDLRLVLARPSTVGLRLVNAFHPQMWKAKIRGKSPLECFDDDRVLRHSLRRAIRMWPDRRCWSAPCLRMLVALHNRSRVSNFRPTVARSLIAQYAPVQGEILDFSAGFGGRLLGALTLQTNYTGVDSALAQVTGLRSMVDALNSKTQGSATIIHGCAEELMQKFSAKSFDLVFSSPPYFNLEKYSADCNQSCVRFPEYGSWKLRFLGEVISQSHRILRKKGRLAINVSDLPRHPLTEDTLAIGRASFGAPEEILYMYMSTNPADKARRGKFLRREPIFIFRK